MIKLQSIAQLPTEPSQALSTQMSPPRGDSLILHHLPVIPLHSAFSPEHVCLPGSPSSWTSRHQSLAAWCVCWVCVYVVSVQMCMLGGEGICLNPEPWAERGGNKCPPPPPPSLCSPAGAPDVQTLQRPEEGQPGDADHGGQRSASQTAQGRGDVGGEWREEWRVQGGGDVISLPPTSAAPLPATPAP